MERLGDPREVALQASDRQPGRRYHEVDPHEEPALVRVAVLLAVDDVRRVLHQEAGDRVHDAGLVRAGQGEDVFQARLTHGLSVVPSRLARYVSKHKIYVRYGHEQAISRTKWTSRPARGDVASRSHQAR